MEFIERFRKKDCDEANGNRLIDSNLKFETDLGVACLGGLQHKESD